MLTFQIALSNFYCFTSFLVPSLLLCCITMFLEPSLLILIFEKHQNFNARRLLSKFNFMFYCSPILTVPVLLLTNLNGSLFVGLSCLLLPQIWVNFVRTHRPQLDSAYYKKFLFPRIVLIVRILPIKLYLRSFPNNLFNLEPNYLLTLVCFCIFLAQVSIYSPSLSYSIFKASSGRGHSYQSGYFHLLMTTIRTISWKTTKGIVPFAFSQLSMILPNVKIRPYCLSG